MEFFSAPGQPFFGPVTFNVNLRNVPTPYFGEFYLQDGFSRTLATPRDRVMFQSYASGHGFANWQIGQTIINEACESSPFPDFCVPTGLWSGYPFDESGISSIDALATGATTQVEPRPSPEVTPGSRVRIRVAGQLLDYCSVRYDLFVCVEDEFAELVGAQFSAEVVFPAVLTNDLDPDDFDRGVWAVPRPEVEFSLVLDGQPVETPAELETVILVQDCFYTRACPNKENFVWVIITGFENGMEMYICLNGSPGDLGPESEHLPPVSRLQVMAGVERFVQLINEDFTEILTTDYTMRETLLMEIESVPATMAEQVTIPGLALVLVGLGTAFAGLLGLRRTHLVSR